MNIVEIAKAVYKLAAELLDANEFPWEFLAAFGNNETTIKRLRSGHVAGGVLRRNDAHLAVALGGEVTALRDSATVPRWRRKTRCRAQHLPATTRDAGPARPIAQAGPGARPRKLPDVLSIKEVARLLEAAPGTGHEVPRGAEGSAHALPRSRFMPLPVLPRMQRSAFTMLPGQLAVHI